MAPARRPINRRDFVRTSAAGITALAAANALPPAIARAGKSAPTRSHIPPEALPPYAGAGSTAPVRPFPLYQVTLGDGLLREKCDRMKLFIRSYDERRMVYLFCANADIPNPPGVTEPGGWETSDSLLRGHWAGHYMTALAQCYADSGEQVFVEKLDYMVDTLEECQHALARAGTVHPGYLGAVPEDVVIRLGPPRFAVYGGNEETDTWAPWYTQHKIMRGLLDAYDLTGNEKAREILLKMADWAHLALTLGDVTHPDYSGPISRDDLNYMWDEYIAGEYGGENEVAAHLYELTRDPKHLETAKLFDNRESLFSACVEDQDILVTTDETRPGRRRPNRLHANTHVPQFIGYMRVYEQSGDQEYYRAAKNFFGMVVPHRRYVHGGTSGVFPGSNDNPEMFQNRGNIANSIAGEGAETCTAYNLLKLGRNLFFHDQDPGYMDYYERGLLNQITGSRADTNATRDPQVTYFQPLTSGARKGAFGNTGTCCGGTGMENHTKYQESVYFHSADNSCLWVNLFASSTLWWRDRGFTITQETDYPREEGTQLTVDGSGPLHIKLRVPAWAEKGYMVAVNGRDQQVEATPGSYVTLSRVWSPGDTIEISMPFSIRIERSPDRPATQAIFHGPILLPILGDPGGGSYRELTLYRYLKRDGDYSREAITPTGGGTFVTQGHTLQPWYVGERPQQSPYFTRVEPEIVFGSIRTGIRNVKRNDGLPDYDIPVEGIPSPGDDGPTFLDLLWDRAPFDNHGKFVRAVEQLASTFVHDGLLTGRERATIVGHAAQAEEELAPS